LRFAARCGDYMVDAVVAHRQAIIAAVNAMSPAA
jgi:hypothetical protein